MIVPFKHDSVTRPRTHLCLSPESIGESAIGPFGFFHSRLEKRLWEIPLQWLKFARFPEGRDFKRSSMGDMSCLLPRFRHDDKESIYVLRRIEEMWSDANFTLTQGNHEPLVSQRLV